VSVDQLLGLGLTYSAVHHAVAAGRLHRIHQGVYAVGRRDLTHAWPLDGGRLGMR
jgi:hypothetical protein